MIRYPEWWTDMWWEIIAPIILIAGIANIIYVNVKETKWFKRLFSKKS